MLKIRFASIKDLDDLVRINIGDEKKYSDINRKILKKKIAKKQVLTALFNNRILGLLYFVPEFLGHENVWYLEQVTIGRTHRHKGVGKALVRYFLRYAKSKKISKVFADIRQPNKASLRMCTRCGGKAAGSVGGLSQNKKDRRVIIRFDF